MEVRCLSNPNIHYTQFDWEPFTVEPLLLELGVYSGTFTFIIGTIYGGTFVIGTEPLLWN